MRINCRHLVIAIVAITLLLVAATGAAMGADQVLNTSSDSAVVNDSAAVQPAASSGSGQWPTYVAGGVVIAILAVGILYIFRERSGR